MIREGATLIESPAELLIDLGWAEPKSEPSKRVQHSPILDALTGETLNANDLARRAELEIGQVLVELARLELSGSVVRAPGGLYRRASVER